MTNMKRHKEGDWKYSRISTYSIRKMKGKNSMSDNTQNPLILRLPKMMIRVGMRTQGNLSEGKINLVWFMTGLSSLCMLTRNSMRKEDRLMLRWTMILKEPECSGGRLLFKNRLWKWIRLGWIKLRKSYCIRLSRHVLRTPLRLILKELL